MFSTRKTEFKDFLKNYCNHQQKHEGNSDDLLDKYTMRGTVVTINDQNYLLLMEHYAASTDFCLYDYEDERSVFTCMAKLSLDGQAPAGASKGPGKSIFGQCILDELSVHRYYKNQGLEQYMVDVAKQFCATLCKQKGIDSMLLYGPLPTKVSPVDLSQINDNGLIYLNTYATSEEETNRLALFTQMGFEPDYIGSNGVLGISDRVYQSSTRVDLPEDFLAPVALDGSKTYVATPTQTHSKTENPTE